MSVEIIIDTSEWDEIQDVVERAMSVLPSKFVEYATPVIKEELIKVTPVKTGKLRDSITSELNGDIGTVRTNAGYGKFVDEGTKPHVIRPRVSEFLRFEINGRTIYAKQVNHPGTSPQNISKRAIENSTPRINEIIVSLLKQEIG